MPVYRDVVFRCCSTVSLAASAPALLLSSEGVNVNDEIGLDPFCSYTLAEYLVDLAKHDGLYVVRQYGDVYTFHNGTKMILNQQRLPVDEGLLNEEEIGLVTGKEVAIMCG